jgi:hypothetical protein
MPPPAGLLTPCGQSTTIWKLDKIFGLDFPASPEDLVTTGILVFSGGTPVTVTIARNHIFDRAVRLLAPPVRPAVRPLYARA